MKSNREMISSVMSEVDLFETRQKHFKKKRLITLAAIIALIVCMGAVAGATNSVRVFSAQWRQELKSNIINASSSEEVAAFDEAISKSEDKFAQLSLQQGTGAYILPDYSTSEKKNITEESGEFIFTLNEIVAVKQKHRVMVGGSLGDGSAQWEWTVSDAYYAMLEISRADGKALSEEEVNRYYRWHILVSGYEPVSTSMCTSGYGVFEYSDGYKKYYAVEITPVMIFAENELAVAAFEEGTDLSYETFYADKDGTMEIKDSARGANALLRFSVDENHADKKAVRKFVKTYCINDNFNGYER